MTPRNCLLILLVLSIGTPSCSRFPNVSITYPSDNDASPGDGDSTNVEIPVFTYRILNTFSHDSGAFTQGLVVEDSIFYEGTGLNGRSSLRKVDLNTGDVLKIHNLTSEFFGEGITVFGDRIIQITWRSRIGFVYDKESFAQLTTFTYPTEGWGLTHDGSRIIMSDGTSNLYFRDPESLDEIGRIQVTDDRGPVSYLNELEYIKGEVYANIWLTDTIARISPETGKVTGWIDLKDLLSPMDRLQPVDVLNGIAYDADHDRLFVTGKLWPRLFEIQLIAKE